MQEQPKVLHPEILAQRDYYAETAGQYDAMHIKEKDEHQIALSAFCGMAALHDHASFVDIGAGTGRGVRYLKRCFPQSRVIGVEPVAALRDTGLQSGDLEAGDLVDGDATSLPFPDDAFDWCIATAVLHHIRDWERAVTEMCRVARVGVMLSDANNIGQGKWLARSAKFIVKKMRLWPALIYVQTRGKGYKYSESDGIYYSFCVFDAESIISAKFDNVHRMNTSASDANLSFTAPQALLVAWR